MRTPRRHRGGYGTLCLDRLLGFYRLYHLSPRSVFAVSPCHIGSHQRIARGAAIAPDLRRLVERLVVWLGFSAHERVWWPDKVARHSRPCAGHPRLVFL